MCLCGAVMKEDSSSMVSQGETKVDANRLFHSNRNLESKNWKRGKDRLGLPLEHLDLEFSVFYGAP